jgi:hypothetical protein
LGAELGGLQSKAIDGLETKGIAHMQFTAQVAQTHITDEIIAYGTPYYFVKDPVNLYIYHDGHYYDSKCRPDNMPAQSLQVVYKRHFSLLRIPVE